MKRLKSLSGSLIRDIKKRADRVHGWQNIHPCLVIAGGGAKCISEGGAQLLALHEAGLLAGIEYMVMISAAAVIGVAIDAARGPKEALEICLGAIDSNFIKIHRFRLNTPHYLSKIEPLFREPGYRHADRERRVIVTSLDHCGPELLDPWDEEPGLFRSIEATMSVPGFCSSVSIRGKKFRDGGVHPLPYDLIRNEFRDMTHLLYLPICSYGPIDSLRPGWVDSIFSLYVGASERRLFWKFLYRWHAFRECVKMLDELEGIERGALWLPPKSRINIWTTNIPMLWQAHNEAKAKTTIDLNQALYA